jgi:predicted N-acetyltransferase YhbS
VSPGCRGKGYGRKLIEAACDRVRKLEQDHLGLLADVAMRRPYGFRSDSGFAGTILSGSRDMNTFTWYEVCDASQLGSEGLGSAAQWRHLQWSTG